ncbi:MAG: tRNA (N(6)-L-threonylcarbamoyladenosine(37)-C(2))-methylthiotransferase MtaB [Candidatus Acidiferrales bacterium]
MATFHIENFGCRATWADAAAIARQFSQRGYARAGHSAAADVLVLNTCTVTADADAGARQAIRRAHRANPSARIVVTGCYAQRAPEELAAITGVSLVVGNSHLTEIAALCEARGHSPARENGGASLAFGELSVNEPLHSTGFVPLTAFNGEAALRSPSHVAAVIAGDIFARKELALADAAWGDEACRTRPVLKIQDGCDQRCAYCVIPFVRGRSRSLAPAGVVAEVQRLVAGGAKEIVLSGINLGSYGRDLAPRSDASGRHAGLIEVLRRILDKTSLERLRLSSIEPMDVTRDLLDLFASTDRLARHFHIPLQSGSDRLLRAMHRWYKAAHYAQRVKLVRELLPGAGIGADVIAGFPGETDEDHRATMELIAALPFTYLHVFSFSSRPGTEAARLLEQERAPQVPPAVVKQRVHELRALAAAQAAAFRAAHAGHTLRALTLHTKGEDARGPWTDAICDNYLKVRVPGHQPANQWRHVALDRK